MKLFEVIFDENTSEGVFAISIVTEPAIQSNFIAMSAQAAGYFPTFLRTVDAEKRIVTGAILIPDKAIFRRDSEKEEPYYIFFSKDTVAKIAENYQKRGRQAEVTLEHQVRVEGITLTETWLVENNQMDKLAALGLTVPNGTWAGTMKIDNEEVWNDYVKTGELRGFSVEGFFNLEDTGTKLEEEVKAKSLDETYDEVLQTFKNVE